MTTIPLDDQTLASLIAANRMVAVSDSTGQVVGFFAPIAMPLAAEYATAAATIYPTKDAHRNAPRGKGRTTAEVCDYLRSLGARYPGDPPQER
jgi:hypothetical protein